MVDLVRCKGEEGDILVNVTEYEAKDFFKIAKLEYRHKFNTEPDMAIMITFADVVNTESLVEWLDVLDEN